MARCLDRPLLQSRIGKARSRRDRRLPPQRQSRCRKRSDEEHHLAAECARISKPRRPELPARGSQGRAAWPQLSGPGRRRKLRARLPARASRLVQHRRAAYFLHGQASARHLRALHRPGARDARLSVLGARPCARSRDPEPRPLRGLSGQSPGPQYSRDGPQRRGAGRGRGRRGSRGAPADPRQGALGAGRGRAWRHRR